MEAGSPGASGSALVVARLSTGLAAAGLISAALLLAPSWADGIGNGLNSHRRSWFAGLLDSPATWWHGQQLAVQMLYVFGVAALIALSGGSFGVALLGSGIAAYVAEHGHGEADFVRDPSGASRSYFASTTPQAMVLDLLEFGLTFWPAGAVGATVGREARAGVQAAHRVARRAAEEAAAKKAAAKKAAAKKAEAKKAEEGAAKVATTLAPTDLTEPQLVNLLRYTKKLPAGAQEPVITRAATGSVQFESTVPGRVPGPYATYTEIFDRNGVTTDHYQPPLHPTAPSFM